MKDIKVLFQSRRYPEIIGELNPDFKMKFKVNYFNYLYAWSLYYVFILNQNPLTNIYSDIIDEIKINIPEDRMLYQLVEKKLVNRESEAVEFFEKSNIPKLYKLKNYHRIITILNPEYQIELTFNQKYKMTYLWSIFKHHFSIKWTEENYELVLLTLKIIYRNTEVGSLLYKITMEKETIFFNWLRKYKLHIFVNDSIQSRRRTNLELYYIEFQTDYFDNCEKYIFKKEYEDYDKDYDDSVASEQENDELNFD